ncbi:GFA family protein [Chondromyces apiculatus]|nr:GFA family protein [Chondromyces apiculatus]
MSETKNHAGSCHCGKVRYEVATDLGQAISCNCSMCAKKGSVLTFVPADQFKLLSGQDGLTDYQFNKKTIHHLFCSTCGVTSFARGTGPDGKEMVAVNLRCLDDLDLSSLNVTPVDGKSY